LVEQIKTVLKRVMSSGRPEVASVGREQNLRLNQVLLAALRQWRVFPAIQNGRPVESHQDVRVHLNVN